MKKKIAFLVICTIIETIVYSQKNDSLKIFLTKFQNVAFVTSDSSYSFIRYIAPNGKFYFKEGFVDSSAWYSGVFYGSSEFISPPGNYRLLYENSPRSIDTIYNYLNIRGTEHYKDHFLNVADELIYSYILKQIGESDLRKLAKNTIRIIYPCEDLNYCNHYNVFKIRFFTDSAKLYSLSGRSVDFNGIRLIRIDSCWLKKKDVENITKQLSKVKSIPDMSCRRPGNPWILEYHNGTEYKRFIISNYCFRGQKNLKPIATLCYLILGTNNKYFNTNCSVYP